MSLLFHVDSKSKVPSQGTHNKDTGIACSQSGTPQKTPDLEDVSSGEFKSTPVKMYCKPNVFNQSTPQKDVPSPSSESESSQTPSKPKIKTYDLENVKEKIEKFCLDLDTEFKACLYSVMKQDTSDACSNSERIRRKTKAFNKQISFSLDICRKDIDVMVQSQITLKQYASLLKKDKDGLKKEIDALKSEHKALQELQDMESLLNDSDDNDDDDEFSCSATKKK